MSEKDILNDLDKKNNVVAMEENPFDRQETSYEGTYLGCQIKAKKDKPEEHYGVISMYFSGVRKTGETAGTPWYTVQEQFMAVETMQNIVKDIPFGAKVVATYNCGNTPGGKQRLSKLQQID